MTLDCITAANNLASQGPMPSAATILFVWNISISAPESFIKLFISFHHTLYSDCDKRVIFQKLYQSSICETKYCHRFQCRFNNDGRLSCHSLIQI